MKPGRELDSLVAEKVMGWIDVYHEHGTGYPPDSLWAEIKKGKEVTQKEFELARNHLFEFVPNYSTDIAAAWNVVENVCSQFKPSTVERFSIVFYEDGWEAGVQDSAPYEDWCFDNPRSSRGETAPHAICLAALKAVGYEF